MTAIAKAFNLFSVTEVELIYRNKKKSSERPTITTSKDAYEILLNNWDMNKIELLEQFKIVLLDRRNSCIGISEVSKGGMTGCVVDPKIIFATALKAKATSIIMAHNHPSGNTKPSQADVHLTKSLVQAGKVLELSVLDHTVVCKDGYFSFADEGMMP